MVRDLLPLIESSAYGRAEPFLWRRARLSMAGSVDCERAAGCRRPMEFHEVKTPADPERVAARVQLQLASADGGDCAVEATVERSHRMTEAPAQFAWSARSPNHSRASPGWSSRGRIVNRAAADRLRRRSVSFHRSPSACVHFRDR
jgi:hypothetical protein